MRKSCNKGYTLIEILAVLVVFALISLVAIPMILNVVSSSRAGIYKDNCYAIIKTANTYVTQKKDDEYSDEFVCDGKKCINGDGEILSIKGSVPLSGRIIIDNGIVTLNYIKYPDFCAYGDMESLAVSNDCSNLDITGAAIDTDYKVITKTQNTIRLNVLKGFAEDHESGIKSITVNLYKGEELLETVKRNINKNTLPIQEYYFENLTPDTTYDIEIIIENGAEGITKAEKFQVATGLITMTVTGATSPTTAQNGYVKNEAVNIAYTSSNLNVVNYYVKSTSNVDITSGEILKICGNGINPENCESVSGAILTAGDWYEVKGSISLLYDKTIDGITTLYVTAYDGLELEQAITKTIHKIDAEKTTVTLGSSTVTSKSITIPITASDAHSGLGTPTCKYSETSGSYTSTSGVSVTTSSCVISGIKDNKTYYYQVCVPDKVGNIATCKTGSNKTTELKITASSTNTPSSVQNDYLQTQVWNFATTGNPIGYYIKSTGEATSSVGFTKSCGTGVDPTTCTDITSTTTMTANTWYYSASKPSITYNKTNSSIETLYVITTDGTNTTIATTATVNKIDKTNPTVTLGTATVTSKSVTVPVTTSDANSGLGTPTCKYSTTSGSYTTSATASSSSCIITNAQDDTTYYFEYCMPDKVGNKTCKTGSSKTVPLTVSTSSTNTPSSAQNGYLKQQVWAISITGDPIGYYIKSTSATTSSIGLTKSCGTGVDPTTCTDITSTTSMTANTWYYSTEKPSITYNKQNTSTATLYVIITDGTNTTTAATATVSKIDKTSPTVTLGTVTVTAATITIPVTSSDSESGLGTATCKYSTTSGSYTSTTNVTASTTQCKITGLTKSTTYYFQVCIPDKVGNTATCKTGSKKTASS